jgi:hypothetical protein
MRLPKRISEDRFSQREGPIEVNHFQMDIPDGGYCWVDNAKVSRFMRDQQQLGSAPYMVVKAIMKGPVRPIPAKTYFPLLKEPELFLKFRNLGLDRDAILEFANRYGWIGETCRLEDKRGPWIGAVGLHRWREEIQTIILADHLRCCIEADDRPTLRKYFRWHPKEFDVRMAIGMHEREIYAEDRSARAPSGPFWFSGLVNPHEVDQLRTMWNPGDVVGPARVALMDIINPRLRANCHPHLFLNPRGNFVGHLTPDNLLGCVWLQFYMAVIGRLKLRICTVCRREMDVSESRKSRKMHDSCSRRKRQQRWRAKSVAKRGDTVEDIVDLVIG